MFKSQIELFKYKWQNSNHKCFVTDEKLDKYLNSPFALSLFAHVLRKSAYPELRLDPNNIVLLTPEVHELFDNAVYDRIKKFEKLSGKSFRVLFEFERTTHGLYTCEYGKKVPERKILDRYLNE